MSQKAERDTSGRFLAGYGGGPGRPRITPERRLQYACKIVRRAVRSVKKGDTRTRELLLKCLPIGDLVALYPRASCAVPGFSLREEELIRQMQEADEKLLKDFASMDDGLENINLDDLNRGLENIDFDKLFSK
jgi:hypothetical protein